MKAIKSSPWTEKEHLVTLVSQEPKAATDSNKGDKKDKSHKKKTDKAEGGKDKVTSRICAVPVSKKMPWMDMIEVPEEYA